MEPYAVVVFAHVLAASVLLGTSLVFPLTRRAIRSARTVEELRGWLAFARGSSAANPACALVLLGTGLHLGSHGWWSAAWLQVGGVLFVVSSFLAARTLGGATAALGAAAGAAEPGPVPAHLEPLRWSPRLDVAADVVLANDVAAFWIMIVKPGLAGCVASVAVANAILLAVRRRRRARRPPAAELAEVPLAAA